MVMHTCTIDSLSGELLLSELSPFMVSSDMKFFSCNRELSSVFISAQLDQLRRARGVEGSKFSSGCSMQETLRLVIERTRRIIRRIAELNSEKAVTEILREIEELEKNFQQIPNEAKSALVRWLPSLSGKPLSAETLADHCLTSLRCRIDELRTFSGHKKVH
jgi:hypothetical protein